MAIENLLRRRKAVMLDHRLKKGEEVPVCYDLIFRLLEDKMPMFVFSAHDKALKNRAIDPRSMKSALAGYADLGDFVNSDEELGFRGVFTPCEPLLPLTGYRSWKTILTSGYLGEISSFVRVSGTISLLVKAFRLAEAKPNAQGLQQLAAFTLSCGPDFNGFSLGVVLSPTAHTFIADNRHQCKEAARKAMFGVYRHITTGHGFHERELDDFRVQSFRGGSDLTMIVPGNACSLYVENAPRDRTCGMSLESSNVDSPVQQLTLLAGLGSMLHLIREAQLSALPSQ